MSDEHDLVDRDLASALATLAATATGAIDTDAALRSVTARARVRRRRRRMATLVSAVAAAGVVTFAVAVARPDPPTFRSPATVPAASPPPASRSTTTGAPTGPSTTTATAAVTSPTTASVPVAAPAPSPPASTATTAVSSTVAYDSAGGSITVAVEGGAVGLEGAPRPAPGWSVRVDDDGPTRVRVRFELGDRRSEIRVDLVDGVPVPRITDD